MAAASAAPASAEAFEAAGAGREATGSLLGVPAVTVELAGAASPLAPHAASKESGSSRWREVLRCVIVVARAEPRLVSLATAKGGGTRNRATNGAAFRARMSPKRDTLFGAQRGGRDAGPVHVRRPSQRSKSAIRKHLRNRRSRSGLANPPRERGVVQRCPARRQLPAPGRPQDPPGTPLVSSASGLPSPYAHERAKAPRPRAGPRLPPPTRDASGTTRAAPRADGTTSCEDYRRRPRRSCGGAKESGRELAAAATRRK